MKLMSYYLITLHRKTIQSLFPAEIGQRRATILDSNSDYHRILDKFEAFGKRASRTRSADTTANQANIWLKLAGLLLSIVGFVMVSSELLCLENTHSIRCSFGFIFCSDFGSGHLQRTIVHDFIQDQSNTM